MSDTPANRFRPPAVPKVKIAGFWGPRIDVVADKTVNILFDRCIAAGTLDQVDPALPVPDLRIPFQHGNSVTTQMFWDSDFGKIIETAAYAIDRKRDPGLERRIDEVIDAYARLQAEDGYLDSWFQRMRPGERWTNLRDCHELYNMGHLIEGAVAYHHATGKRRLLDVMCRCMDHVIATLGREPGQKRGYCGHPEVELALVRLARATGERRYLDLATYFVDERGRSPNYFDGEAAARGESGEDFWFGTHEYSQSHRPVREQDKVVGHAVRAMYLYSGMADVATETGDGTLVAPLERLWADLTEKNLYVTGGLGPSQANEGFTFDYDLPNESAYAETCAAVALVFWASRMLGRGPDGRFGDIMEQALYNGALSGLSLDGTKFFYENPLASRGDHNRWTWHRCPCCPPNIARLVASVGSYAYGEAEGEAAVHLYCAGEADLDIGGGRRLRLLQDTHYPWSGAVRLTVGLEAPTDFVLSLRIPAWAQDPTLSVGGEAIDVAAVRVKGYARLARRWSPGDVVELDVGMTPKRLYANPKVRQDAGRVALKRGPLVYCIEAVDNGPGLQGLSLPEAAEIRDAFEPELLGGVVALSAAARTDAADWGGDLYRDVPPQRRAAALRAVPYYAWDNRAPGEMLVWLRADGVEAAARDGEGQA